MRYLSVGEENAHAVRVVHVRDAGKTLGRRKKLRQIFSDRLRIATGWGESVHDLQCCRARELLQQGCAAEALGQAGEEIHQGEPLLLCSKKHAQYRQTRVPGQQRLQNSAVANDGRAGQETSIRLPPKDALFSPGDRRLHAGDHEG
jgi:hypothetical protein